MQRCRNTPPDWSEIFRLRPDLEPPGYRETVESLKDKKLDYEREILRKKMETIHKEKQSAKNRNRKPRKAESTSPDGVDTLLSVGKRGRKSR